MNILEKLWTLLVCVLLGIPTLTLGMAAVVVLLVGAILFGLAWLLFIVGCLLVAVS